MATAIVRSRTNTRYSNFRHATRSNNYSRNNPVPPSYALHSFDPPFRRFIDTTTLHRNLQPHRIAPPGANRTTQIRALKLKDKGWSTLTSQITMARRVHTNGMVTSFVNTILENSHSNKTEYCLVQS
ncbi:hypothetical protein BDN72DRAFT_557650 [Pluteus cervinus]|uniref:Uncharacterized protein n=1 Tax=Pluteus cervinus TaxID=181527 RepID=A0ACD3BB79_9AGAR|nr:hypothetical protein BDN72DRAFT_557650 [Pluteus cervinus]